MEEGTRELVTEKVEFSAGWCDDGKWPTHAVRIVDERAKKRDKTRITAAFRPIAPARLVCVFLCVRSIGFCTPAGPSIR